MDSEKKAIGTIDALTTGFNVVARRPWAVLLPVAVNLLVWLGPRLNIVSLAQKAVESLQTTATLQTGQYAEWVASVTRTLTEWGGAVNLLALLAQGLPVLPLAAAGQTAISVDNWPLVVGLAAALLGAGAYLMALYLAVIAQQVKDERIAIGSALGRAWRIVWRVLALGIVLIGILTLVSAPVLAGIGLLSLFSPQGTAILFSLILWAGLFLMIWFLFYLFFVLDAIALDDVGARHAVSRSVALVRQNTGPTLGLILLTVLLTIGLGEVWNILAKSTAGAVAAIIANAYVGTSLAAASLIFYASRWLAFQKQFGPRIQALAEVSSGQDSADQSVDQSGEKS